MSCDFAMPCLEHENDEGSLEKDEEVLRGSCRPIRCQNHSNLVESYAVGFG